MGDGKKRVRSERAKEWQKQYDARPEVRARKNELRRLNRAKTWLSSTPYRRYKKDHCQSCGFVALHSCQLDVDHIDGNHKNNNPENLQTLCSNCHRLKSYLNKDGAYKLHLVKSSGE